MIQIAQKSPGIGPGVFVAMVVVLVEADGLQFDEAGAAMLCILKSRTEKKLRRGVRGSKQSKIQTVGSNFEETLPRHVVFDFGKRAR
jgi:hypothetical protein